MGYIRHDAIVVTSCQGEAIEEAHSLAVELHLKPTAVTPEAINGYRSFLIPPDGSKEGWSDSDDGDETRAVWKAMALERFNDETGKWIYWVHIQYAGDRAEDTKVVDQHPKE